MGYYTNYELTHTARDDQADKITEYIKARGEMEYAIGEFPQECKWYKWKDDMKVMSEQFPNIIFILEGHGEEYGDIWRATIKNGDIQTKKATITF